MTTHDSRELLIHRLERAPGRQGGRKVLVARDDASTDEATVIGAIESGAHGHGRFMGTWRSHGRILRSLTAAYPPEVRQPPRVRAKRAAAKGAPSETALCHSPEHAHEIAALRSACADATARVAALEQTIASLRDAAMQTHRWHQDEQQRGQEILNGMHLVAEQAHVDLQLTRNAYLDLQQRLGAAQRNLTLANSELIAQRSAVASLHEELKRVRAAGPDLVSLLVAGGAGLAVGAVVGHLLATGATPPAVAGASSEPAIDTSTATVPAPDVSDEAAPSNGSK